MCIMKITMLTIFKSVIQYIKYIHTGLQPAMFSSSQTETLYPLKNKSPLLYPHSYYSDNYSSLPVLMNLTILSNHISGIMQYLFFYICLISLSIFTRFINAIECIIYSLLRYSVVYIGYILFTHSFFLNI